MLAVAVPVEVPPEKLKVEPLRLKLPPVALVFVAPKLKFRRRANLLK
jgi:hypothetical protein